MILLLRPARGLARLAGAALLLTLGLAGCGGRFPEPGLEGEFERTVLLEEGTATWCPYCPEAAENIEALLETHPREFIVLALHGDGTDTFATPETKARLQKLGAGAFPTIIFDGVEPSGRKIEEMESLLSGRRKLGSPIKLTLSASLAGDSVRYEITVIVSAKISEPIQGRLRIALCEDSIPYPAPWGTLSHVVRRLPEPGDSLTLEPGDSIDLYRALPLEGSWNPPLTAVVWIEAEDLEVYQAASYELSGLDLGNFSIEVVGDSIKQDTLGASLNFDFDLRNYTSGNLDLVVDVPSQLLELPEGWGYSLCDTMRCYSLPDTFEVSARDAFKGLHIIITSSTGGTEGKLLMTVASGVEVDTQTFILRIAQ